MARGELTWTVARTSEAEDWETCERRYQKWGGANPLDPPLCLSWVSWRRGFLVVGMALALGFGILAAQQFPRTIRDRAIFQTTSACLAQNGGRADCVPSGLGPDGSADASFALIAEQADVSRQRLGQDLLGLTAGVVTFLLALGAAVAPNLPKRARRLRSGAAALQSVSELLQTVTYPLILVAVGQAMGLSFLQDLWLSQLMVNQATDHLLAMVLR